MSRKIGEEYFITVQLSLGYYSTRALMSTLYSSPHLYDFLPKKESSPILVRHTRWTCPTIRKRHKSVLKVITFMKLPSFASDIALFTKSILKLWVVLEKSVTHHLAYTCTYKLRTLINTKVIMDLSLYTLS